jgi:group I intron endonuclease
MENKTGCIYAILNTVNGKGYIGQTINFKQRKAKHLSMVRSTSVHSSNYNMVIYKAMRKYGINSFSWSIIEEDIAQDDLDALEIYYIDFFGTYFTGYNSNIGGSSNRGYITSEATKEKQRGHPVSAHVRRRISEASTGRVASKETREKLSLLANSPEKQARHKATMEKNKSGRDLAVRQLNKDGEFVAVFTSLKKASEGTGITSQGICNVLKGRYPSIKGYKWEYVDASKASTHNFNTPVLQYSLDNVFIKVYPSNRDAEKATLISASQISRVCSGKQKTARGFIWKYLDETDISDCRNVSIARGSVGEKPILQYDLSANFIREWMSVRDASADLGIGKQCIYNTLRNSTYTAGGFMWRYKEGGTSDVVEHKRKGKGVSQYDMDGKFIRTYDTILSASEKTGISSISICANLKGRNKSAHGFLWVYKNEDPPVYEKPKITVKAVIQYSLEGKFIKSWSCASEILQEMGIPQGNVQRACRGAVKTAGGFIWKYKDDE